jgi:hypothetical protein
MDKYICLKTCGGFFGSKYKTGEVIDKHTYFELSSKLQSNFSEIKKPVQPSRPTYKYNEQINNYRNRVKDNNQSDDLIIGAIVGAVIMDSLNDSNDFKDPEPFGGGSFGGGGSSDSYSDNSSSSSSYDSGSSSFDSGSSSSDSSSSSSDW